MREFNRKCGALMLAGLMTAGCGGGGGGGGGTAGGGGGGGSASLVSVSDLTASPSVVAGNRLPISFEVSSEVDRKDLSLLLELVPIDPMNPDTASVDPFAEGYEAHAVQGMWMFDLSAGIPRTLSGDFDIPANIPAGTYAAVLRVDTEDSFGRDLKFGPGGPRRRWFGVATDPVVVAEPTLPDLRVVSFAAVEATFSTNGSAPENGGVESVPEEGAVEEPAHLSASIVFESLGMAVTAPVALEFALEIPGAEGGSTVHALGVRDPWAAGEGPVVVPTLLLPPGEDGTTVAAGAQVGLTVELVLPQAAVDELMARDGMDLACALRVALDPADAIEEWNGSEGNEASATVIHLAAAGPEVEQALQAEATGGRENGQAVLAGPRFDAATKYRFNVINTGTGAFYGRKDRLSTEWNIGATLSWAPAAGRVLDDGQKVTLVSPLGGYLGAANGGGAALTANTFIGSWETFTLEVAARNGSTYEVRFRAPNGTHWLGNGTPYIVNSQNIGRLLDARMVSAADAGAQFQIVDLNDGELVDGDPITVRQGQLEAKYPSTVDADSFNFNQAAAVSTFRIVSADASSPARKAKFFTDNYALTHVFNFPIEMVRARAAADMDAETLPGSYFEWEGRVLGIKLWGSGTEFLESSGEFTPAVLWDSGSLFVVSKTISKKVNFWVGPVPLAVTGGVVGNLGIKGKASVEVGNRLSVEAGPHVSVDGFVKAGVDIALAGAGVGGSLNALSLDPRFKPIVSLPIAQPPALSFETPVTIETMNGKLFIYVEWNFLFAKGEQRWDFASWVGYSKVYHLHAPITLTW